MKIHLSKKVVLLSLIVAALFISYVSAQSVFDIEFPVAELGNCANKEECKTFCSAEENFAACRAFASKYGLRGGAEDEDKFEVINEDGGPGNCAANSTNPIESCRSYCNIASNMKMCVAYAKTHNLMEGQELEEAEKVLAALERGAKLPAGCTDKESCQRICEEPANVSVARECFAFAEAAGLLPPGVDREQAEKFFRAIEEGRAPFRSPKDFEQCDNPQSDEILEKCISFAVENGFISGEEAEMVKKTGGRGPGGCRGREQCEAYCQTNQDECFAFAEEHNLISPEDKARMEEGMRREYGDRGVRREFGDQFPPEIKACLESKVGAEGVKRLMESGPSPEVESAIRGCFEMNAGQFRSEDRGGEGYYPPEGFPQNISEEEMRRIMEERRRQMQSPSGYQMPPEPAPTSLIPKVKGESLLANVIYLLFLLFP